MQGVKGPVREWGDPEHSVPDHLASDGHAGIFSVAGRVQRQLQFSGRGEEELRVAEECGNGQVPVPGGVEVHSERGASGEHPGDVVPGDV